MIRLGFCVLGKNTHSKCAHLCGSYQGFVMPVCLVLAAFTLSACRRDASEGEGGHQFETKWVQSGTVPCHGKRHKRSH